MYKQHRRSALVALLGLLHAAQAVALSPFAQPPEPQRGGVQAPGGPDYRNQAARHLYATYPSQVLKGKVRANVYAIVVTETELDAQGKVLAVRVLRKPSHAPEVAPWVVTLIRRASPLPAHAQRQRLRYVETWLVDASGQFQLRTLTEGQL